MTAGRVSQQMKIRLKHIGTKEYLAECVQTIEKVQKLGLAQIVNERSTRDSRAQQEFLLPPPQPRVSCADRQAPKLECTHTLASTVAGQLGSFADFEAYIVTTTRGMPGDGTGSFVWLVTDAHGLLRVVAIYGSSTLLVKHGSPAVTGVEPASPSTSVVVLVVQLRAGCSTFVGTGVGYADERMCPHAVDVVQHICNGRPWAYVPQVGAIYQQLE
ncbi:hypothetical protein V8E53_002188 [Lactarius tabidus]